MQKQRELSTPPIPKLYFPAKSEPSFKLVTDREGKAKKGQTYPRAGVHSGFRLNPTPGLLPLRIHEQLLGLRPRSSLESRREPAKQQR